MNPSIPTRIPAGLALALLLTTVTPPAALAVPANDLLAGAVVVSSLPFAEVLDVTTATSDADDAQVNESCGAPVTNNSVWYQYTAGPSDGAIVVDVSESDFNAGAIIAIGGPGNLETVACAPHITVTTLTPGTVYYILAFDDTGKGGVLNIKIRAEPRPAVDLRVKRRGKVDAMGYAQVRVAYRCTGSDYLYVAQQLVQIVKSAVVDGAEGSDEVCDGKWNLATPVIVPYSGAFIPKRVAVLASAVACSDVDCDFVDASRAVRLRFSEMSLGESVAVTADRPPTSDRPLYRKSNRPGS
jgi:hypothetical protein